MQPLDHGPRRLVPERIVALVDDDDGVGDPPGFVDGLLVVRVKRIQGIEPAAEGVIDLRGLERVQDLNGLTQALAVGANPCPGETRSWWRSRPWDRPRQIEPGQRHEIVDDGACALAAARAADQADVAVIADSRRKPLVLTASAQPEVPSR